MPILSIIIVLVVCGLVWYLIDAYMPASPFKVVLRVLIVLFICIWLLQSVGVIGPTLTLR